MRVFENFEKTTLDDYHPRNESQEEAKAVVGTYIEELPRNYELIRGLLLVGPAGVGKTMLANIVLNAARGVGYSTEALSVNDFFDIHFRKMELGPLSELLKGERWDAADQWEALIAHLDSLRGDTQFVLFDDLGQEHDSESGWSRNRFGAFLRSRYVRGLPTLLTSNIQMSKWEAEYSPSMESFVHESSIIVPIVADDERL